MRTRTVSLSTSAGLLALVILSACPKGSDVAPTSSEASGESFEASSKGDDDLSSALMDEPSELEEDMGVEDAQPTTEPEPKGEAGDTGTGVTE